MKRQFDDTPESKLKSTRRRLNRTEWFMLAGVAMGLLHWLSGVLR